MASRSSSSSTSSDCNFSPPGFQASSATPPQRRRNTTKPSPPRLQPKTSSSPHAPAAVSAQPASRLAVASIRAATQACQPRAVSSAQSQQLVERQPAVPSVSKQSGSQSQPLPPPAGLSDANAIPVRSFAAHQPAERPIQPVPQQQLRQHRQRSEPRPLPVQQPGRMSSVNSIPVASHTRPGAPFIPLPVLCLFVTPPGDVLTASALSMQVPSHCLSASTVRFLQLCIQLNMPV